MVEPNGQMETDMKVGEIKKARKQITSSSLHDYEWGGK